MGTAGFRYPDSAYAGKVGRAKEHLETVKAEISGTRAVAHTFRSEIARPIRIRESGNTEPNSSRSHPHACRSL